LIVTRPNIIFGIGLFSIFLKESHMYHLQCVKRILQCIKDTLNKGVPFYASNNGIKLDGYTNND